MVHQNVLIEVDVAIIGGPERARESMVVRLPGQEI